MPSQLNVDQPVPGNRPQTTPRSAAESFRAPAPLLVASARLVAVLLVVLGLLAGQSIAPQESFAANKDKVLCHEVTACKKSPYRTWGYDGAPYNNMYWRMYSGSNCTNYVAYRFVARKYDSMPNTRPWATTGAAYNWGIANAYNSKPTVGSVAWWSRGHVAYVERIIDDNTIWVSESSAAVPGIKAFVIQWRQITRTGDWPTGFIHFKDEDLNATTKPTISGTPQVGVKLTLNRGAWRSSSNVTPTSTVTYTYQWYANGTAISGATGTSYTPTAATVGKKITVKVTAKATGYKTTSATTSATAAVAQGAFKSTTVPSVSGTAIVGGTLTASNGTWSPTPSSYLYQWYSNGTSIPGATGRTYSPTGAHVGQTITVRVTARASGYKDASKTSAATGAVQPVTPVGAGAPTISGPAVYGQTLTVDPGTWSPAGVVLSYQWNRDGTAVPGATAQRYELSEGDLQARITVTVTGQKPGLATTSVTTAATDPVFGQTVGDIPSPVILGNPAVGQTLTALLTLTPAPERLVFQWYRDGEPIEYAEYGTYVLLPEDAGASITVSASIMAVGVIGAPGGYVDVMRYSSTVGPVVA